DLARRDGRPYERVRAVCACCGGGYSAISKELIGCSTARNKGTCDNRMRRSRARKAAASPPAPPRARG
ncbi:hypothetical protein VB636_00630, partial [Paracoccus sp. APAP_BH8]|uniref:hypothetical protein n=1 Tax=Paracoccus sp. APAP_BH8 TaxID=3110237 RepID=UPI002FD7CC18